MPVFTQQSESKLSLQSLLKRHVNPGSLASGPWSTFLSAHLDLPTQILIIQAQEGFGRRDPDPAALAIHAAAGQFLKRAKSVRQHLVRLAQPLGCWSD